MAPMPWKIWIPLATCVITLCVWLAVPFAQSRQTLSSGAALPATCVTADVFVQTTTTVDLFICASSNLWQAARSATLGRLVSANFNSTADQPITISSNRYVIRRIVVTNASTNLTLAVGGFYTGAGKSGTVLVAAVQVYTTLTTASKFLDVTLAGVVGTDIRTETTIFLSLTTAQGAPATADVYVLGDVLP